MAEYTIKQLCKIYSKCRSTMYGKLQISSIKPKRKGIYDESIIKYLDKTFRTESRIEIIEVPVYHDVNWLLIPSRMNYEKISTKGLNYVSK